MKTASVRIAVVVREDGEYSCAKIEDGRTEEAFKCCIEDLYDFSDVFHKKYILYAELSPPEVEKINPAVVRV